MWYDIDKYAEGVMRSAERSIKAAEQRVYEPPWDGFCGLVRVCDDEELKERGVIRAVVRTAPASATAPAPAAASAAGAIASGGDGSRGGDADSKSGGGGGGTAAAAALSNWLKHPRSSDPPEQEQGQQQQQPLQQQQHGVLTPWQQQDPATGHPTRAGSATQPEHLQPHNDEQQQQRLLQQQASTPAVSAGTAGGPGGGSRTLLSIGSFSGSEGGEGGGDLGIHLLGASAAGAAAADAAGGVPDWVAACLLDAGNTKSSTAAAAVADSGRDVVGQAGQQNVGDQQQQQQKEQEQGEVSYQQQQADLDRILQEVFAAAEQEVQAEDSPAAVAGAAEPGPGDADESKPQVSPTAAAAAAVAAEQSLQAAPDAAAAAEFATHADRVSNLIDLDDTGSNADLPGGVLPGGLPGGVAIGAAEGIIDDVEALLAAADEAAVLEAKFDATGVRTPDLSSLGDLLGAGPVKGSVEAPQEGATAPTGPAVAAAAGSQAEPAVPAPLSTEQAVPADAVDLAGDALQNPSHQDEVNALLAAAEEAVALESKHGPGVHFTVGAADVAARVSALGVTSAAGLESKSSQEGKQDSGEGGSSGSDGKGSDAEDGSGSSDGSSSSSDDGSFDSDEDEWLDDLPVAPSHAAVQQQPKQGGLSSGAKGRRGRKRGPGAGTVTHPGKGSGRGRGS